METVDCNLCGSTNYSIFYKRGDVIYTKCLNCNLVWENPRLDSKELIELYSNKDYYTKFDCDGASISYENSRNLQVFESYYKLIKKYLPQKGNALDVGCAKGIFLEIFRNKGFNSFGVELSEVGYSISKDKGFPVFKGKLYEASFDKNYFDVITMIDVLEHFQNPKSNIIKSFDLLKDNGILFIETPNIDDLMIKFFWKEKSNMIHPRTHIYLFTKKTVRKLLEENGFKILEIKTKAASGNLFSYFRVFFIRLIKKICIKFNLKIIGLNRLKKWKNNPKSYKFPQLVFSDIMYVIARKETN